MPGIYLTYLIVTKHTISSDRLSRRLCGCIDFLVHVDKSAVFPIKMAQRELFKCA